MSFKNKQGSLTAEEKAVVKALLADGWRNQDIQALLNIGRVATINSARITEVKSNNKISLASKEDVAFFIKKKNLYDPKTGLNLYDNERLIRAREAMILAVHVFNNPSIQFKTETFAVQANIAWTYLLHEYYEQKKGIAIVGKDGRSLLLSQMIKRTDCPLSAGMKNNLEDMIDIRNDVEHKLLRRADLKFFPKFQACCLNFDKAICDLFGERLSLKSELSLSLQFAKLDFEQIKTLHKYDIPSHIEALDARLNSRVDSAAKDDLEYQFRVVYTLEASSKSQSHIQFVRPGSEEGKEIHYVLEKYKAADEIYPYKPGEVCAEVAKRTGKRFTQHNHTQAAKLYKARPAGKSKQPANVDKKYCIYHPAYKSYTYAEAWIEHLVSAVTDDDEFAKLKAAK